MSLQDRVVGMLIEAIVEHEEGLRGVSPKWGTR